jgi:hypothetical protein
MIFLLLLPFASFFGMLVLLATYGEIIENRSGFEEWLIVMAVLVIVRVFMMGMNRIDRQGRMSGELWIDRLIGQKLQVPMITLHLWLLLRKQ